MRLFPFEFRVRYEDQMQQLFRDQQRDLQKDDRVGILKLWSETIRGILTTAPREHLSMLRQDVRYALRMMRRTPGTTGAAVLTLAIGIGANTALFSIVNAFVFRPLPVQNADQLVSIATEDQHVEVPHGVSYADFLDYRQESRVVSDIILFVPMHGSLSASGRADRVMLEQVSANYFSMLRVNPATMGIYAVMSFWVSQRTHELGVRMALGAASSSILRLVIGRGMVLVVAGVLLGMVAAAGLSRPLGGLLIGVSGVDPLTYTAVAAFLTLVALAACYVPARRATQLNPLTAIRVE